MRPVLTPLAFAICLLSASSAQAEKRMFIVANNASGYGVDRCLASGESCGEPVATAYCRARDFNSAVSYRKVDREEITGAVSSDASGSCRGATCEEFVVIECTR